MTEEEVIIRKNKYDQSSIMLYRKQLFRLDPSFSEEGSKNCISSLSSILTV